MAHKVVNADSECHRMMEVMSQFSGIEHNVQQRSAEWFQLRANTLLTSSQFGDAIGVGRGRPYDFFQSLISEDSMYEQNNNTTAHLQHGIKTEVIIKEAYEMLTGNVVRDSGFWVPGKDSCLKDAIGASPDGIVMDPENPEILIGLTEFKAPVYKMYTGKDLIKGIPRHYMAQVQGQMAVVGARWCDFLAICTKTREVILKRVYSKPSYWLHVSKIIAQFCHAVQEARVRKSFGRDTNDFLEAKELHRRPLQRQMFPDEGAIIVEDLVHRKGKLFRGPSGVSMSFDLLMGYPTNTSTNNSVGCVFEDVDDIQRKRRKTETC